MRGATKLYVATTLAALILPAVPAHAQDPPTKHQHQGTFITSPCVPNPNGVGETRDRVNTTRRKPQPQQRPRPPSPRNHQPAPPTPYRIPFQARTGTATCQFSLTPTEDSIKPVRHRVQLNDTSSPPVIATKPWWLPYHVEEFNKAETTKPIGPFQSRRSPTRTATRRTTDQDICPQPMGTYVLILMKTWLAPRRLLTSPRWDIRPLPLGTYVPTPGSLGVRYPNRQLQLSGTFPTTTLRCPPPTYTSTPLLAARMCTRPQVDGPKRLPDPDGLR